MKVKLKYKNFLLLTIAGIINAFGVTVFLAPVALYDSGISGTSMLISQKTPDWLSLSVCLLVLNVPIFLYGLKKQGITFTIYAIYTVAIYSLAAWLITDVLPIDVSIVSPLAGSDLFLCAIFGGIISGIGSGLAIRAGGAMDGIEVLAIIFAKKLGITVGTFVMIYNVILYVICGFAIQSWILPLYSIVTYAAALKTVDFIIEGFDRSKAANIITTKPKPVCVALSEAFENGITIIDAKGYYSDSKKTMLYFVVNRFQVGRMTEIIQEIDPGAYISLTEVADIYAANLDKEME
ncbi:MAG: YitT family protein [Lachnospiraceae bacterium]|nr:YitT family protein [Lachnospiraceae bacterium]